MIHPSNFEPSCPMTQAGIADSQQTQHSDLSQRGELAVASVSLAPMRLPSDLHTTILVDREDKTKREIEIVGGAGQKAAAGDKTYLMAISQDDKKMLGGVSFRCRWARETTYGTETGLNDATYYSPKKKNKERAVKIVWIDDIRTQGNIKGIGRALMQAVMECSFYLECKGRIALDAHGASPGFYYKLGMRSPDEVVNKMIPTTFFSRKDREELHPEHYYMYLPAEAVESWKERIQINRLFKDLA